MTKKYLKKIIAQNSDDLRTISAICSEALVNQSEIKYLKKNKVFLIPIERLHKEDNKNKNVIRSIIKFDYIDASKSKNIDLNNKDKTLKMLAIDIFKKDQNYEIVLLFLNNEAITLTSEVIEVTLEDLNETLWELLIAKEAKILKIYNQYLM